MQEKFKHFGVNMSMEIYFVRSHFDLFPENLGNVSNEQDKRFDQNVKIMKERYQAGWDV